MSNIVIFGAPHSGKTTLLGYLSTAMLRHPQLNEEILQRLKLIKKLGMKDYFHIEDPYNPVNVHKDIILPSFVSLDRDELRKFVEDDESSIGGSKRLHHKQLTLCMSERKEMWNGQNENENISCTFIDLPGFRQRISDKYRGFFEGDIGLAVLDICEVLKLDDALKHSSSDTENQKLIYKQERKLFEPVRIWCDYRSPEHLLIVLSKVDQVFVYSEDQTDVDQPVEQIKVAVECIRDYAKRFSRYTDIPIVPISIRITQEENKKARARMKVFFKREEENIYADPKVKNFPGSGTLITCLRKLLEPFVKGEVRAFSMASVDRLMRTDVNNTKKTVLQIRAVHGALSSTDIVSWGPVLDKRTKEICYTKCKIASLKADGAVEPCSLLLEGNVGGVIFKWVSDSEERPSNRYRLSSVQSDSDIKILPSTIIFKGAYVQGDIVTLEINKKEYLTINGDLDKLYTYILRSLMPYDEMTLFWYGKKILVKVVEIKFSADKLCLSVILSNSRHNVPHFVLPSDESGEILYQDNVLLAIPDTNYLLKGHSGEPVYTYICACLNGIKDSKKFNYVYVKGNSDLGLSEKLKGYLPIEDSYEDSGLEHLTIPIRSDQKNYSINATLSCISRSLKNGFNRIFYREMGGVEMTLVKNNESMSY